jgi:hypothetical protein
VKVKNISTGPRGVHAVTGEVSIDPGKEIDVELSEAEFKSAEATGHFEFDGEANKPLDKHTKAELVDIATAEGVTVEDGDTKAELVDKIEAARAA